MNPRPEASTEPSPAIPARRFTQVFVAFGLFCATAIFVLWQNTHVAVLWDLSYLLDSSWRIALGQHPYRDFPFAHAPLTFMVQAAIIRLTGRVYWHHIVYAVLAGATATLLTWRILANLLRNRIPRSALIAAALAATLIPLGTHSIYPFPIYDSDAVLFVLLALYLLERTLTRPTTKLALLTGASLVLPLFFKQNIGLFFLASIIAVLGAMALLNWRLRQSPRTELLILTGVTLTLGLAALILHLTVGLHHYYYWTITFAAQRRLPGLGLLLGMYRQTSLRWTIPTTLAALYLLRKPQRWAHLLAFTLLALPFLTTLITTPFYDDPDSRADALLGLWPHILFLAILLTIWNLIRLYSKLPTQNSKLDRVISPQPSTPFTLLLPIILLATIHGTFLSQQLWGSTYAVWPLLLLLLACIFITVPALLKHTTPLTALIVATFLLCGVPYALSYDRLNYTQLDGSLNHSTLPALSGMTTPGPWLPALDELIRDTGRTIPAGDTILLFPGQDPFYYASGRTPRFPVLLFDPATNPYSPRQLAQAVIDQNVRWLILPKQLQLAGKPLPNYDDFITALQPLFTPDHETTSYTIYHRR